MHHPYFHEELTCPLMQITANVRTSGINLFVISNLSNSHYSFANPKMLRSNSDVSESHADEHQPSCGFSTQLSLRVFRVPSSQAHISLPAAGPGY
jgi:hypothetical protein